MNWIEQLAIGVGASLIAAAILIGLGALGRTWVRRALIAAFGSLLRIDVDEVYPSQRDVADALANDMRNSEKVDVFAGRGSELVRETFAGILGSGITFRLLLPDPDAANGRSDWISQRANELEDLSEPILREQIRTNIKAVTAAQKPDVRVRLYDSPHLGRIVITNRAAYLTPYRRGAHGRDCPVIKYRAGGDTYAFLQRYFDLIWEASPQA